MATKLFTIETDGPLKDYSDRFGYPVQQSGRLGVEFTHVPRADATYIANDLVNRGFTVYVEGMK